MMLFETEAADGTPWEVAIRTDIERFRFPGLAPTRLQVFDYDAKLRWADETLAWPVEEETPPKRMAFRAVDYRSLHYEPPTEEELERVRQRRLEWEQKLLQSLTGPGVADE